MGGGFEECRVKEQRVVDGVVFPKVVLWVGSELKEGREKGVYKECLSGVVRERREWVEEQVRVHGALLLRGLGVETAEEFEVVVEALGWPHMEYVGLASRTRLTHRVYTANEAPPQEDIYFHHEMSQTGDVIPSKILFFCETPPKEGGQTPIIPSHKITERMEAEYPEFVRDIENKGIVSRSILNSRDDNTSCIGRGWQSLFAVTDRNEAEKKAATMSGRLEWLPDNRACYIIGPIAPIRVFDPSTGKKVWFNVLGTAGLQLLERFQGGGDDEITWTGARMGDGCVLPPEPIKAINRIQEEEAVAIPWNKGDVMILDNLAVMHGRKGGKPPRRILAAICK